MDLFCGDDGQPAFDVVLVVVVEWEEVYVGDDEGLSLEEEVDSQNRSRNSRISIARLGTRNAPPTRRGGGIN